MQIFRPRRSVLYVPAINEKALAKIPSLAVDAVIVDLEDAVAPGDKTLAQERLRQFFTARPACETIVRINALSSEWGADDLRLAASVRPDAVLLPKVETPRDIVEAADALAGFGGTGKTRLWAMIETARALVHMAAISELGRDPASRLVCLVAGTNDLVKETGVLATPDRRYLVPWLMQMVLGARAGRLDILDGVSNNFRNLDAFEVECREAAAMGFDGKTLIHPAQIAAANAAFSPSATAIAEAQAIVAAFRRPENAGKGVISLDGRMIERLHLEQAERLLAKNMADIETRPD